MTLADRAAVAVRAVAGRIASLHDRTVRQPRTPRVAAALAGVVGTGVVSVLDVGCGDGAVGRALASELGVVALAGVDVAGARAHGAARFDGVHLPYPDGAFDVVLLADVLHHAADPGALLREALRVASRSVAIKEHVARGWGSRARLLAMDVAGNAGRGVAIRGRYFDPAAMRELVAAAGGRIERVAWPVHVHAPALRSLAPSELQIALSVVPRHADARRMGCAGPAPEEGPS